MNLLERRRFISVYKVATWRLQLMPTAEAPVRKAGSPLRWLDSWIKRLTAIVVLVAGVLGIYKTLGGNDTKTPGNLTLITDVTVIENQYQEATGKPLTDAG